MADEIIEIEERLFDLSSNHDLSDLERWIWYCEKFPERNKILTDETIQLPFRHVRIKRIKEEKK